MGKHPGSGVLLQQPRWTKTHAYFLTELLCSRHCSGQWGHSRDKGPEDQCLSCWTQEARGPYQPLEIRAASSVCFCGSPATSCDPCLSSTWELTRGGGRTCPKSHAPETHRDWAQEMPHLVGDDRLHPNLSHMQTPEVQ